MSSRGLACYFAAFAVILVLNAILQVKGQPTVQDCENGDLSNRDQMRIGQLNNQVQSMQDLLIESLQNMKSKLDTVMTSLRAVDRRSQEQDIYIKQVQSIHSLLITSFQQMKSKQDTVMTSLQAVDRRSQEQDIYIKQVQSMQGFLNASNEQMKSQHDAVLRNLEAIDRRLREHDISITNKTQNSWKLEIAYGIDFGEVPILLSTANDWIVIMHRFDGSLDFYRNWTEYRNGFGDIGRGEFWLGNEKVHRLTNRYLYILRIEVFFNGTWLYADYATFSLGSEDNKYTLHLSGFSGNAGDSLTSNSLPRSDYHGGMNFSTWDSDSDRRSDINCADSYQAGWWFNSCMSSCLTCPYRAYFLWHSLSHRERLRSARMMIKGI